MRSVALTLALTASFAISAAAQTPPPGAGGPPPGTGAPEKENANPCRDEVAAALAKLRKSSWFRMNTNMITENGPMVMEVDYVLPDRMHQKVTQTLTNTKSEIILVGDKAWAKNGDVWSDLPTELTQQLKVQMTDTVLEEQKDIGNYSCKGKVQLEGRDALSYKLEQEVTKDTQVKNEAFRMFYVDAVTGLPLSNAMLTEKMEKPIFKAVYSYPIDLKIEQPATVGAPPAASGAKAP